MRPLLAGAMLAVLGPSLSACSEIETETAAGYEPATLQAVKGRDDLKRVTLTAEGARRIGLKTAEVDRHGGQKTVPYAALIYDAGGGLYVYTALGRGPSCDRRSRSGAIDGNRALLSEARPPGPRWLRSERPRSTAQSSRSPANEPASGSFLMRWIVSRSLRFRWLVLFAATAIMAFGVAQIPSAKVDVFPEFAPPRVEIQTIALGNSSNEVEELITIPIEEQLTGLPGLEELRSKSVSQLSAIELIFERGTDEVRARQLVQERIAQVTPTLPNWASPPWMMPPLSATSRIMKIGVSSDELNLVEMSSIAYWKIRQQLMRVPGVASVDIYGERLQQRHVQVDPSKLAQNGVSLERVMETAADAVDAGVLQYTESFVVGTGGFVEGADGQRMNIQHVQPVVGPRQLAKVPIAERSGRTLRLGDVGRVVETHMPVWGEGVVNEGNGLLLIVQKFRGANTMEVTRGVEQAVDEMRPGLPGLQMDTTIFRPATFIEQSIDNLTTALLLGVLLVAVVICAFLFEWRTAFISLIAIPLSLIAAILVLDLTETTINVMVLAGLVVAIGVVVDDAIIDVENIVRRLRQTRAAGSSRSTFGIVLDSSVEVRSAITYATVINVVAIVPVFFLQGAVGLLLPAARPLLRPGRPGLDVGRAHGHAGALPAAPLSRAAPAARVTAAAGPEARLRRDPGAHHSQAEPGDRHRRHVHAGRASDLPDARQPAPAELQGAGLPHALAHGALHVRSRGEADLDPSLPRPARDPGCPQLRLSHRAGPAVG